MTDIELPEPANPSYAILPTSPDEMMSSDEQPCLESSFMDSLRRVPQLLMECSRQNVLKELRSLCREARVAATAEVTRITVNVDEPVWSGELQEMANFLTGCSVRCLTVVLHSISFGE